MSDIERLKAWLRNCPNAEALEDFVLDYTSNLPGCFGIFPSGLVEVSRTEDILGNITAENQYNFALYIVFPKSPGDDVASLVNADWIMEFQKWVQSQSALHLAPAFGDIDQQNEKICAQNGALLEAEADGLAIYMVQLSANFKNYYEVN